MGRTPVWKTIADSLSRDIASGRYQVGDKLPTEAQLSQKFAVNRHTVRRAIAALVEDGLVFTRRGAGVFVDCEPTEYRLGQRVRYHKNLAAAGRLPGKEVLNSETRAADTEEAEVLSIEAGEPVHVHEGISLSDGQPIAAFLSVFPAGRFPELRTHLVKLKSVTAALSECGVTDYLRQSTRLTAVRARADHARHLRVPEGAPMILSVSVNVDLSGNPIEYGRTWFAGDRVTLMLEHAKTG
ncbi:MAG: phosphonate metabolism transcriptional regulator PhnF [Pseudomonadota bacterium]